MAQEEKKEFERAVGETSLTAPSDRDSSKRWRPDRAPPLTEDEGDEAVKDLHKKEYVYKYPRKDRSYADPDLPLQTYGLISFVPAKGAQPNARGIYGFAKLRGNFKTLAEADQRAEHIIRNHDSYHNISTCWVGRPFPFTNERAFSEDVREIDIRKEEAESMSEAIKRMKKKDKREIEEIQERERLLKEDVKKDDVEPFDNYITNKVKKAQLTWTYQEHAKKMEECKNLIIKARNTLDELDSEYPDFKHKYFDKYMEARKSAGLEESKEEVKNNFMKYLVEDVELDF